MQPSGLTPKEAPLSDVRCRSISFGSGAGRANLQSLQIRVFHRQIPNVHGTVIVLARTRMIPALIAEHLRILHPAVNLLSLGVDLGDFASPWLKVAIVTGQQIGIYKTGWCQMLNVDLRTNAAFM